MVELIGDNIKTVIMDVFHIFTRRLTMQRHVTPKKKKKKKGTSNFKLKKS